MPVSDYTPGVSAVAAHLLTRTKTQGGAEAGTFAPAAYWTDSSGRGTRPTAEQVADIVIEAAGTVSGTIGAELDPIYWPAASSAVALRAAMLVELRFFSEQINTGKSIYPQLKELWDEEWGALLAALGLDRDDDGKPDPGSGFPSYGGFPETGIGMEFAW